MAESTQRAPLSLEICAIDRAPYRAETAEIALPGEDGLFVVLPGHAPLVAILGVGVLKTRNGAEERCFAINSGIVRVLDNQVLVLTRTAEAGDGIDRERAEAAKKRAEDRLSSQRDKIDVARAEASLRRAMVRLMASNSPAPGHHA